MATERSDSARKRETDKFVTSDPEKATDEAVARALKRVRGKFNFTDEDLRRLGRSRRRWAP